MEYGEASSPSSPHPSVRACRVCNSSSRAPRNKWGRLLAARGQPLPRCSEGCRDQSMSCTPVPTPCLPTIRLLQAAWKLCRPGHPAHRDCGAGRRLACRGVGEPGPEEQEWLVVSTPGSKGERCLVHGWHRGLFPTAPDHGSSRRGE